MANRADGGFGWAVVFGAFVALTCTFGTTKLNGVLFVYFRQEFNATNSATSVVSLTQRITESATALIFSFLAERFGSRVVVCAGAFVLVGGAILSMFAKTIAHFTVTYGFLIGLATAMIVNPSSQMIPRYFDKKIALASAITFSGAAFGPLIMPPVMQLAIAHYGLSGSFAILACFYLHVFIAATLFRHPDNNPKPVELSTTQETNEEDACHAVGEEKIRPICANKDGTSLKLVFLRYKACLCNKLLLTYYFSYFIVVMAYINWIMFQQAHIEDRGFKDRFQQAILVSVSGVGEIVSRILLALVLHYKWMQPHHMTQLSLLFMGALFAIYPFFDNYWLILGASALVGCFWSAIIAGLVPVIRFIVGLEQVGPAIGLICLPNALGYASLQLGGFVRDLVGSFVYVYYFCAAMLTVGAFALEAISVSTNTSVCINLFKKLNKK